MLQEARKHFTEEEIEKYVIRKNDENKFIEDDDHFNSNSIVNYLDDFKIHEKMISPHIDHKTGFGLTLLKGDNAHIHSYNLEESEVFLCLDGEWEVSCDDQKIILGSRDAFSPPKNSQRSIKNIGSETGSLFIIRNKK